MNETKGVPAWVGIVNLILAVLGMAWSFYDIIAAIQEPSVVALRIVSDILTLILMVAALEYGFKGFKKGASKIYKFFTIVYVLFLINAMMYIFTTQGPSSIMLIKIIAFGCIAILTVALDLGKKKSTILCSVNLGMAAVELIITICMGVTSIMQLGPIVCVIASALTIFIMVFAKYKDKDARGTI